MSLLWRGENDFKRGDTSQTVHQAAVRKDMIELKNIQKQESFYTIAQLYTYALTVNQFFISTILARQNYIKVDIILPGVDRYSQNASIHRIKSVNTANI